MPARSPGRRKSGKKSKVVMGSARKSASGAHYKKQAGPGKMVVREVIRSKSSRRKHIRWNDTVLVQFFDNTLAPKSSTRLKNRKALLE